MNAIDFHVHHRWNDPDLPRPDRLIDQTKALAYRSGISKVVLLTLGMDLPPEELHRRNSTTLRLMEEDPDFFLGGMYLNPTHEPEIMEQEAVRCVRAGFVAIKQHMDLVADDPKHDAVSRVAAELDIPIVWHAWYKQSERYENESNAGHIARLAKRNPRTKYVMAHMTGVGWRGILDVADLPNVWVDTSGGWPESELVEYAVRQLGADRIVFGSDFVGRDYAVQLGRVLGARISDEDKEKVLWKNAASLLKLEA
ncbi:MAG: amidohydrolase family protein [Candidatus Latescibacteria bacterium]|jgi:hypothetical protein|nr:amidohydrolase family protein [Candidatus Latescibacterota bacterium]